MLLMSRFVLLLPQDSKCIIFLVAWSLATMSFVVKNMLVIGAYNRHLNSYQGQSSARVWELKLFQSFLFCTTLAVSQQMDKNFNWKRELVMIILIMSNFYFLHSSCCIICPKLMWYTFNDVLLLIPFNMNLVWVIFAACDVMFIAAWARNLWDKLI